MAGPTSEGVSSGAADLARNSDSSPTACDSEIKGNNKPAELVSENISSSSGLGNNGSQETSTSASAPDSQHRTPSWVELLSGDRRPSRTMSLRYIEPIAEGESIRVSPQVSILEEGVRDWALCLVGHFLDKKLPFQVVKTITRKIWAKEGLMDVLPKGNGVFFFKFSQCLGRNAILDGGPQLIVGRHLFLRRWEPGLDLSVGEVDKIPVWIQLHGIPMEYWTEEGLSCLASAVGVPLYADAATENWRRITYARICVELDASKPLVKEFVADTYSSKEGALTGSVRIRVVYQWRPPSCSHCVIFGHTSDKCPKMAKSTENHTSQTPPLATHNANQKHEEWRPVRRRNKRPSVLPVSSPTAEQETLSQEVDLSKGSDSSIIGVSNSGKVSSIPSVSQGAAQTTPAISSSSRTPSIPVRDKSTTLSKRTVQYPEELVAEPSQLNDPQSSNAPHNEAISTTLSPQNQSTDPHIEATTSVAGGTAATPSLQGTDRGTNASVSNSLEVVSPKSVGINKWATKIRLIDGTMATSQFKGGGLLHLALDSGLAGKAWRIPNPANASPLSS